MSVFIGFPVDLNGFHLPEEIAHSHSIERIPQQSLHCTQAYIKGSQRPDQLEEICSAIQFVSPKFPPFTISFDRWGLFGESNEVIALCGDQSKTPLHTLTAEIRSRLISASLYVLGDYQFRPHVSLAKLHGHINADPDNHPEWLLATPVTHLVHQVCLYEVLEYRDYKVLCSYSLGHTAG